MKIGFIGLGAMGSAMAHNLLASGHTLSVFNRNPARCAALAQAGAQVAASGGAELVITMVADDAAAQAVTLGADGLAATLAPGALHVSMSTIGVATAQELAAAHRQAGQRFVAAPVFGRPDAAAARKLFIMAAGDADSLALARPVLEQLGQSVGVVGSEPSQANLVKLIGNFMLSVILETLGEACGVAGKAGIEPLHLISLLTNATFNAPPYKLYGQLVAGQQFQPPGFALPLGQKDNRLILAAAEALGVPLPLASLMHDRFLSARARGLGFEHDWSAVALCALADAGQATLP